MRISAEGEAREASLVDAPKRPAAATRLRAQRVLRVSRVVGDLERAETFYAQALDFRTVARGSVETEQLWAIGARYATARQVVMRLGDDEIALVQFACPGRPYPADTRSDDLWFQGLAIVVDDMEAACAQLSQCTGWTPITVSGPVTLPSASGSLRAFKFRDPDGHPLALLRHPPARVLPNHRAPDTRARHGPFREIDHTSLAIRSTRTSLAFYRTLGMQLEHRLLSRGTVQAQLDALPGARVRITHLRPAANGGPGIELHAYRPPGRASGARAANDIATEWVTLAFDAADERASPTAKESPARRPVALQDPDGYRLLLVHAPPRTEPRPAPSGN